MMVFLIQGYLQLIGVDFRSSGGPVTILDNQEPAMSHFQAATGLSGNSHELKKGTVLEPSRGAA